MESDNIISKEKKEKKQIKEIALQLMIIKNIQKNIHQLK